MAKAVVLLADGFEEVEAVTSIDFLARAGIEVTVAGVTGMTVTGAHGLAVRADRHISRCKGPFDAVVVPGGMPGAKNIAESKGAVALIRSVKDSGGLVAAICAAPAVVLAPNGFLDGKRATCYPGYEKEFKNSSFSEERVVVDGKVVTSRGPGTAAEFAIKVIELVAGAAAAGEIRSATLQKS